MKDKILLFIPMYNCEKQIERVLKQLNNEVQPYIDEVLVVDNGSTDNSIDVVKKFMENTADVHVTLIKNKENYSLGGSHKVAIKYAKSHYFDYLIVLHGDDQAKIADLIPYLKSGEYKQYDCLLGSRFMKGSKLVGYKKSRIFANKIFNLSYSISAGRKLSDLGSGLNMYRVEIFASDFEIRLSDSLTFNCELLLESCFLRHKIKFFPISWYEEDQKSNVKAIKQTFKTFSIAISNFFGKKSFFMKDHRTNKSFAYEYDIVSQNFEPRKTKVLITGAAGYVGSQLAYKLYKLGYELVLIDSFSYGNIENLRFSDHSFENEVIKMDICDKKGIESIMKDGDIDFVFNFAEVSNFIDTQSDPQTAIEVNVAGLMNIMENARKYGIKKIVQASTNALYENETTFPTPEEGFKLPTLIYPNTKYCAERFLQSYADTYNMNITCLKFANVYGPHIDCLRKQPPFVGYMIRELYYDRTPEFLSDGKQKSEYIYIDDLIDLALRVLRTSGYDYVNCSSKKNYSVNELYTIIQKKMNKNIPAKFIDYSDYWKNYPELYSGAYTINDSILEHEVNKHTICDNTYAKTRYGWKPQVDIETGLEKVIKDECELLKKL